MNPLIGALDVPSVADARALADRIGDAVGAFKVGLELYGAAGPAAVRALEGRRVFLDLKLHDIPTTVARAVRSLAPLGLWMLNVHALGGRAMLEAAVDAKSGERLIAVTILSSLDDGALKELALPPAAEAVPALATLARDAGCDGVVCAPADVAGVRALCPAPFLIVAPGSRPGGANRHDQARVLGPAETMRAGADFLVVGRTVTGAPDPRGAALAVLEGLA